MTEVDWYKDETLVGRKVKCLRNDSVSWKYEVGGIYEMCFDEYGDFGVMDGGGECPRSSETYALLTFQLMPESKHEWDSTDLEPEWVPNPMTGECPIPDGHDVELKFPTGETQRNNCPEAWYWDSNLDSLAITHYRDWTAFNQQQTKLEERPMEDETITTKTKVLVYDSKDSWVRFDLIESIIGIYAGGVVTRIYTSLSNQVWIDSKFTPKELGEMVKWL